MASGATSCWVRSPRIIASPMTPAPMNASLRSVSIVPSRTGLRAPVASLAPFKDHCGAAAHSLEDCRVPVDLPDHVHRAGGADLVAPAGRRGAEEDAERRARRPVRDLSGPHHRARVRLRGPLHGDLKVDLVPPAVGPPLDGQRLPDGVRRLDLPRADAEAAHHSRRWRKQSMVWSLTIPTACMKA